MNLVAALDSAAALIEQADDICLACHVLPDGDALGSMLAFAHALRASGRTCVVSFGDPFVVPETLRFLPGRELLVPPSAVPAAPGVMVVFDAASVDRLGSLAAVAGRAEQLIVIDHHAAGSDFGAVRLVDPGAAATAVLTTALIDRLGVELTEDIAVCLYTGLASDTGSFKHASTTPETHRLAARLLAAGVSPEAVGRELWDRAPFDYLQVLAGALGRARLDRAAAGGLGLVWTAVRLADRSDRHEAGHRTVPYDLLDGMIDIVRRTEEAEVAVVCKELTDGRWYVSTRSKGRVDVGRICTALGGGGHARAAAFSTEDPPDVAVAAFVEAAAGAAEPLAGRIPPDPGTEVFR